MNADSFVVALVEEAKTNKKIEVAKQEIIDKKEEPKVEQQEIKEEPKDEPKEAKPKSAKK